MTELERIRAYLAANYPTSVEEENHHLDGEGNIIAWGFAEFGNPPNREQMLAWTPNPVALLPALDSARQAKWLAAREAAANALIAAGWSLEQTMQAGAEFVNAYAALSFGYWYGGAAGTTPQTNLLLAIQADTEREWLDLGSPTVREQMLAILL